MLSKILLVIKREYITRVRKKSFIVMTILAPILAVLFYGVIIYFAVNKDIGENDKIIYVTDASGEFTGKLKSKSHIKFTYGEAQNEAGQKELLNDKDIYAILEIPASAKDTFRIKSNDQLSLTTISYLQDQLEEVIKDQKLRQYGIDQAVIESINRNSIKVKTEKFTESGLQDSNALITTGLGIAAAILIYFFIFLYGVQIMQGVIEEKTNRIIEVIISSIKPFELMMGKIIGIALVGLTQFLIWIVLVMVLGSSIYLAVMSKDAAAMSAMQDGGNAMASGMMSGLFNFNFSLLIGMFLFYFIGGYLFYGSLFAAIGSAVDNETDKQQFMLPVTLPLVFALMLSQSAVVANPNSPLAFWLSIIPFTSPIAMMVRIPFGVPVWQMLLSMGLMIIGFIGTVWIAGRIYRIGILMYGKKPTYKEIGKWLFYKN